MANEQHPTLLVFAYACAPTQGSEYGAGWGVITALNTFAELIVLTGSRDIDEIRTWEESAPAGSPRFVEVSDRRLGRWMRWNRMPEFILYLLWLRKAKKQARHLIAEHTPDAVVHATYSTSWLPTPATDLGLPSVWGPVGGGVTTPRPLWRLLGVLGMVQEVLDLLAVRLMASSPATHRAARRATRRLLQNDESLALLPADIQDESEILNHALFSVVPPYRPEDDGRYALWVSPMEARKGPQLVIEALAKTKSDVVLRMVGDGPRRRQLERLADDLGVADRVAFTGWLERTEAIRLMRGATTVVFTGLREEGGLALAEAMFSARRIVVLDHGGAGAIARTANDPRRVALIRPGAAEDVASECAAAIDSHFAADDVPDRPLLDRDAALAKLRQTVASAIDSRI